MLLQAKREKRQLIKQQRQRKWRRWWRSDQRPPAQWVESPRTRHECWAVCSSTYSFTPCVFSFHRLLPLLASELMEKRVISKNQICRFHSNWTRQMLTCCPLRVLTGEIGEEPIWKEDLESWMLLLLLLLPKIFPGRRSWIKGSRLVIYCIQSLVQPCFGPIYGPVKAPKAFILLTIFIASLFRFSYGRDFEKKERGRRGYD